MARHSMTCVCRQCKRDGTGAFGLVEAEETLGTDEHEAVDLLYLWICDVADRQAADRRAA